MGNSGARTIPVRCEVSPLKKIPIAIPATSHKIKKMVGIRIAKAAAFLLIVKAVLKRQSRSPNPTREKIRPDR